MGEYVFPKDFFIPVILDKHAVFFLGHLLSFAVYVKISLYKKTIAAAMSAR